MQEHRLELQSIYMAELSRKTKFSSHVLLDHTKWLRRLRLSRMIEYGFAFCQWKSVINNWNYTSWKRSLLPQRISLSTDSIPGFLNRIYTFLLAYVLRRSRASFVKNCFLHFATIVTFLYELLTSTVRFQLLPIDVRLSTLFPSLLLPWIFFYEGDILPRKHSAFSEVC